MNLKTCIMFESVESVWPKDTIYYEQTGSTFTVYLVMNDVVISERIFQTEENAKRCLEWYPILRKEPSIAIQEFQLKQIT
jgi:hypothetical protein